MNHKKLIVLYISFALIATLGNLGAQRISLSVFEELGLIFAIGMGTLIGLIIKYILDKRWMFFFLGLAILNEFVWRTQTEEFWVNFKVWGMLPITIIFTAFQIPLINKYKIDA